MHDLKLLRTHALAAHISVRLRLQLPLYLGLIAAHGVCVRQFWNEWVELPRIAFTGRLPAPRVFSPAH